MSRILDLCGGTGAWSQPYRDAGYDVEIVDPMVDGRDVRLLQRQRGGFVGILAAPPCTVWSYARNRYPPSDAEMLASLSVVDACFRIRAVQQPRWFALENPRNKTASLFGAAAVGILSMGIRRSGAQTHVSLGRLHGAAETAEAAGEGEHVQDVEGERQAGRRGDAIGVCAGLL